MGGTLRPVITGIWRCKAASHRERNKGKCIVYYNALYPICNLMHLSGHSYPLRTLESFSLRDYAVHIKSSSFLGEQIQAKVH